MKRLILLLAVAGLFTGVEPAQGALILVTGIGNPGAANARIALGGNDFVDWAQLGPSGTNVPNPFNATSNLGDIVSVSKPDASTFERRNQGAGWNGNFAPAAALLWTSDLTNTVNPISVFSFAGAGISAAGTQIQNDSFGGFTARIEAFDSGNVSLGFFHVGGNSNSAGDNSALFIGVRSTTTAISRIAFSIVGGAGVGSFAINRIDFDNEVVEAVPEPTSLALLGMALSMGGLYRWRRGKSTAA